MPGALDDLREIRDRLADLPGRLVEHLQQTTAPTPVTPETGVPAVLPTSTLSGAVSAAAEEAPVPVPSTPSFAAPALTVPETLSYPTMEPLSVAPPMEGPIAGLPSGAESLSGPSLSASAADTLSFTAPGGGEGEILSMLRQLVSAQSGDGLENGRQRGGRTPPSRGLVQWSSVWEAPPEGYPGAASPSVDVSNIAGTGGASSRRGLGSYGHPGRYWQPESDEGIPR